MNGYKLPSWAGASADRYLKSIPDQWLDQLPDLEQEPQLAILAALDAATICAVDALVAAHPEVEDIPPGHVNPPQIHLASTILILAEALTDALHRYRIALAADRAIDQRNIIENAF